MRHKDSKAHIFNIVVEQKLFCCECVIKKIISVECFIFIVIKESED